MNTTAVNESIGLLFPQIDESLKMEISQKVNEHMMESLKEKAYADDLTGVRVLDEASAGGNDISGRSKMYGSEIAKKFVSLPIEVQKKISAELDDELVGIIGKVYQAYV